MLNLLIPILRTLPGDDVKMIIQNVIELFTERRRLAGIEQLVPQLGQTSEVVVGVGEEERLGGDVPVGGQRRDDAERRRPLVGRRRQLAAADDVAGEQRGRGGGAHGGGRRRRKLPAEPGLEEQ